MQRRGIVLAYGDSIALFYRGRLSMPVPTIGTGSNLLDEPYSLLPRHGPFHQSLAYLRKTRIVHLLTVLWLSPECCGCQSGAFGHGLHLGPGDLGFNLEIGPGKGPKTAVRAGDDVFLPHDLGIAHNPLCH